MSPFTRSLCRGFKHLLLVSGDQLRPKKYFLWPKRALFSSSPARWLLPVASISIFFFYIFTYVYKIIRAECNKIFKSLTRINTITQKKLLRMSISSHVSLWGNLTCWPKSGWGSGVQWRVFWMWQQVEEVLVPVPVNSRLPNHMRPKCPCVQNEKAWALWSLKVFWHLQLKTLFILANSFVLQLFTARLWCGKHCSRCWGNSEQTDRNP